MGTIVFSKIHFIQIFKFYFIILLYYFMNATEHPVISLFDGKGNVTSTVISVSWFLNSTGGSLTLEYVLSYLSEDGVFVTKQIQNSGEDGSYIMYDITGLHSNTSYQVNVLAIDVIDSLYSDNISTDASTKGG